MNRYIRYIIYTVSLFCWSPTFWAQTGQGQTDTTNPQEESPYLMASDEDKRRVIEAINKDRLEMMLRQWWNLPTRKESERRAKGIFARYFRRPLAIGADSFDYKSEVLYRRTLDSRVLPEQNVVSMGWHRASAEVPHYNSYSYALLSHIAYHSYELNPFTGGYRNFEAIYGFKNSDFVPAAHLDTCAVLLSVTCSGEDAAIFFTSEDAAKRNLADSLIAILEAADADGIELSFEEVPRRHKSEFIQFVKDLTYQLREANNEYTIMMSIPVYDFDNVYDLYELRAWIDYFIITGFNHHITPLGMVRGAIAPLRNPEAAWRGTRIVFNNTIDMDSLVRMPNVMPQNITLLHDKEHQQKLRDSLNSVFALAGIPSQKNLDEALNILFSPLGAGVRENPEVRKWLKATQAVVEFSRSFGAVNNSVNFFLFKPEFNVVYESELEQFLNTTGTLSKEYLTRDNNNKLVYDDMSPESKGDPDYDLLKTIQDNIDEIGESYKSSLVMGLPYHGAVWHLRGGDNGLQAEFEGYAPYAQIRQLIVESPGRAEIRFDKAYTSMVLRLKDTTGSPVREIFFDNSATLEQKIEAILNTGISGVSMWALGYDVGYTDLWRLYEQSFALPRIYNAETNKFEKLTIEKSNKIAFTIQYHLKRLSRVIFGTFFIVAIFMILGFNVVLLDWKVRDILFYTGAFRIFYLTLFSMLVLFVGAYAGLFVNGWVTFFVGTLIGLGLTWLATVIIQYQQAKLP